MWFLNSNLSGLQINLDLCYIDFFMLSRDYFTFICQVSSPGGKLIFLKISINFKNFYSAVTYVLKKSTA